MKQILSCHPKHILRLYYNASVLLTDIACVHTTHTLTTELVIPLSSFVKKIQYEQNRFVRTNVFDNVIYESFDLNVFNKGLN